MRHSLANNIPFDYERSENHPYKQKSNKGA